MSSFTFVPNMYPRSEILNVCTISLLTIEKSDSAEAITYKDLYKKIKAFDVSAFEEEFGSFIVTSFQDLEVKSCMRCFIYKAEEDAGNITSDDAYLNSMLIKHIFFKAYDFMKKPENNFPVKVNLLKARLEKVL